MAIPPKFAALKLREDIKEPVHTLELYLDYVCPFSKKLFMTLYTAVLPEVKSSYPNLQLVFRPQIQPWHPSSTLVHEAALAVLRIAPPQFWDFSAALFDRQVDFFDANTVTETRNQTYRRLARLAGSVLGEGKEEEVYKLLKISDKPDENGGLNSGNGVTSDVKQMVKYNRSVGVHVTPTVLFNGLEERSISSSWTKEQWVKWLENNAPTT